MNICGFIATYPANSERIEETTAIVILKVCADPGKLTLITEYIRELNA
jgi:hypothetical protein